MQETETRPTTDEKANSRLFINVLRGIAVFLMLWGHCIQYANMGEFDFFENSVFKVIYSFHMPLFMLISGYLFYFSMKKRSLKELLIHRTQSMLQPIIMCSFLQFLLTTVLFNFLDGYFRILFADWGINSYWFLWSVLSASIVMGIACKVTDKKWVSALILTFGVLFVIAMPCGQTNLFVYPYFVIGCLYAAIKETAVCKKWNALKYISLVLFPVMMLFFRKEHYIYTSGLFGDGDLRKQIPVDLFRWAIGLVGSVFIIVLLELVFRCFKNRAAKSKVIAFFEKAGQESLQMYTLSCIFLSTYLPYVFPKLVALLGKDIFVVNMGIYNFVFTPLLAVCYVFGIRILVWLLKKAKIHGILFGK